METFAAYQLEAKKTRTGIAEATLWYPALGLTGEAGEVAEKVKKIYRDSGGRVSDETRAAITKELGDVLWYLTTLAGNCGIDLEEVATANIKKLRDRQARGKIHGSGDNR